ncbi:hypothetical protein BJ875DRAFT_436662 [Amylocarpus encephaloides]|uniref:Uncharacterized protein n=1 Tax=Amylocarpus encephaloides TaxID=45428 RepID=A0A9P8C9V2_9HELO|nr:hypothetical protein BJ875DRAFT_436662 [Amylocarpus encephaloides]
MTVRVERHRMKRPEAGLGKKITLQYRQMIITRRENQDDWIVRSFFNANREGEGAGHSGILLPTASLGRSEARRNMEFVPHRSEWAFSCLGELASGTGLDRTVWTVWTGLAWWVQKVTVPGTRTSTYYGVRRPCRSGGLATTYGSAAVATRKGRNRAPVLRTVYEVPYDLRTYSVSLASPRSPSPSLSVLSPSLSPQGQILGKNRGCDEEDPGQLGDGETARTTPCKTRGMGLPSRSFPGDGDSSRFDHQREPGMPGSPSTALDSPSIGTFSWPDKLRCRGKYDVCVPTDQLPTPNGHCSEAPDGCCH